MNENTSNKTTRLSLGLAILVAIVGFTGASIYYRHSHQLQVLLDTTSKELQQTKSDLERIQSASEQTARDVASIQPRHGDSPELKMARFKLASMRADFSDQHPAVRDQVSKIAELERAQELQK